MGILAREGAALRRFTSSKEDSMGSVLATLALVIAPAAAAVAFILYARKRWGRKDGEEDTSGWIAFNDGGDGGD